MKEFGYTRASSPSNALALAGDPSTRFLAGGTNLVDLMKLGVEQPDLLVDISAAVDATIGETPAGGLHIGAGARNSDVAAHPDVRRRYPVLTQALLAGASGQLRNLATVGGNLLQRTRCSYFQDVTKPCNKRSPGSGCPARDGEHRNLAILGASRRCVATHSSDMAVALAALDAIVHVETAAGRQSIEFREFYRSPGEQPHLDTTMPPGALITAIEIPPLSAVSRYRKVRERASFAFAITSVAVVLEIRDGTIAHIRLAFGAVAPMPWRARTAEDLLRGRAPDEQSVRAALEREFAAAEPLRDNGYKIELCTAVAVRVVAELAGAHS